MASGRWLALHAATAAAAGAPAATSATLAVASISFTLALRCPNLHDMLFESLDSQPANANELLEFLRYPRSSHQTFSRKIYT